MQAILQKKYGSLSNMVMGQTVKDRLVIAAKSHRFSQNMVKYNVSKKGGKDLDDKKDDKSDQASKIEFQN